jgi:hypothetical protein
MAEGKEDPKGLGAGDAPGRHGAPRRKGEADNTPYAIPGFRDIRGEDPEVTLLDIGGNMIVRRISRRGVKKLFRDLAIYMTKAEL